MDDISVGVVIGINAEAFAAVRSKLKAGRTANVPPATPAEDTGLLLVALTAVACSFPFAS